MSSPVDQSIQKPANVVGLLTRKQDSQKPAEQQETSHEASSSIDSFNESFRKNMENAERLRRERLKANQGVLKSYKIKNQ
jgi:hypothetical protein